MKNCVYKSLSFPFLFEDYDIDSSHEIPQVPVEVKAVNMQTHFSIFHFQLPTPPVAFSFSMIDSLANLLITVLLGFKCLSPLN